LPDLNQATEQGGGSQFRHHVAHILTNSGNDRERRL